MARTHLRQQAGGDPAQGPVREMANPEPSPAAGNDFPDAPQQSHDDRPSDQPDPDEFAALVGTDNITGVDGEDGSATDGPRGTGEDEIDRPHGTDVNAPVDAAAETPDERNETTSTDGERSSSRDDDSEETTKFDWRVARDRASGGLSTFLSSASDRLRRWSDRLAAKN